MKNFIRLFVAIIVLTASSGVYAQRVGLMLGLNLSNLSIKDDDNNYSKDNNFKMNPGLHLAVTVDIPVYEFLSLEVGLMGTTKGYKCNYDLGPASIKVNEYLFYLDFPIMIKGTLDLEAVKLYAETGPYLGVGLYGIQVTYTDVAGLVQDTTSHTVKWGSGDDKDLKRFDMGLTFGGGVEIGAVPIFLNLSYDLGLVNMAASTDNGFKTKSGVLKISLGYRFGKNADSKSHKKRRR